MVDIRDTNWNSASRNELERIAANLDSDSEHPWRAEGLRALSLWLAKHGDVWSHVEVSGFAIQLPNGVWANRCLMIRLADESTSESCLELAAQGTHAYRATRPLRQLPNLLSGVFEDGELPKSVSPIPGHGLRTCLADGVPYTISSASAEVARFDSWTTEQDEWPNFQLEAKATASLRDHFANNGELSTWMEIADRRLRTLGYGSPSDLVNDLQITRSSRDLDWNSPPYVKICARLPLRVSALVQADDRSKLFFDVHVGTTVEPTMVQIKVRRTEKGPSHPSILEVSDGRIHESQTRLAMDLDGHNDIEFLLLYKEELIQSGTCRLEPPLRENLRLTALHHFESPEQFLADGLKQIDGHNAHSFERSVAHLLGVLGFSTFYWGPDHNSLRKVLPTPDHQADLLAFAADDQNCLLVECTLDVGKADKLLKLRQRASQLQEFLAGKVTTPPNVHPVFAIRIPRAEVPGAFSEPARTDNVTLLTKDELDEALSRLSSNVPSIEILKHLPEPIRCGWEAQRGFRVWPHTELV